MFVIWFSLLVLMPKRELYYTLEQVLAKEGIQINEEAIEEGIFSLTLKKPVLYVKGIKVATVDEVTFFTLLLYTKITSKQLLLDKTFNAIAPRATESISLTHSLVDPFSVFIAIQGDIGRVSGSYQLEHKKIHLDILEAKEIDNIKSELKKDEKGWYYETSFLNISPFNGL